jgi:UDP:flavonoid glycosyltransferase YjiC (YdhE family)
MPVRVLLTLGGALPVSAVYAPPNVTVRDFVRHDLLLGHMAAVISHGGLSTVTAALTAGIPLLCVPQGRDQWDNARRATIAELGGGETATGAVERLARSDQPGALSAPHTKGVRSPA